MIDPAQVLAQAARHQQSGQLAEAERLYRQVLTQDPTTAQALHLLGTVAIQAGNPAPAIQLIGDAIRRDRTQAAFHANLAEAYRLTGDLAQAIASNERALQLQPKLVGPHANLGAIHYQQRDWAKAVACYRQVVRLAPDDSAARIALGRALRQTGKPTEAEACFRRAVRNEPDNGPAHALLGLALLDQRKTEEAKTEFEAALRINPSDANAHNYLGTVLKETHQWPEAEQHLREAARLDPSLAAAHNNLGALLLDQGRHAESIDALKRATELDPQSFQAHCNLARALDEIGQLDAAVAAAQRTIELNPEFAYGYANLGTSLKNLGRLDEAFDAYRTGIRLDPQGAYQHSDLIYSLNFHGGFDAATIFAEHRAWGRAHADPLTAAARPHTNDRTPDRRLRIGYVSAHFCAHAVNYFTEPILASHDHQDVEVFCYSNGAKHDETNQRLRTYADHWREILPLDEEQAAKLVRDDKIDVLVDLSGHIGGNRLLLFARKPAPVQMTYIGYQNTTGMQAMDYRLTDQWSDQPGETDAYHTEKLIRLPQSFFCYRPSPDAPPVGPLPATSNGFVTFGSFNNFAKITPEVLATWARILQAVPGSRFVLLAHLADSLRAHVMRIMAEHGVGEDRLTFVSRCPRPEYLEHIGQVDVALDPFPFNGHTTTCDALWQGVPVVALAGTTYASRFGSSALVNLGLEDLIADSPERYHAIAVALANDVNRLTTLRVELRDRMQESCLLDFAGFTRHLETAYRQAWTDWCNAPAS